MRYKPTEAEQRLMEVLLNPDNHGKSITEKCELANIARLTYYRAMEREGFLNYYRALMMRTIISDSAEILEVAKQKALEGSFQHAKMLLEMAGLYTNRIEVDQKSVHFYIDGRDVENLTNDELYEIAREKGVIAVEEGEIIGEIEEGD